MSVGIREYVISPVLIRTIPGVQYARRRRDAGISQLPTDGDVPENVSWTEMRTSKLLDTGISGAITGGVLRGMTSEHRVLLSSLQLMRLSSWKECYRFGGDNSQYRLHSGPTRLQRTPSDPA